MNYEWIIVQNLSKRVVHNACYDTESIRDTSLKFLNIKQRNFHHIKEVVWEEDVGQEGVKKRGCFMERIENMF